MFCLTKTSDVLCSSVGYLRTVSQVQRSWMIGRVEASKMEAFRKNLSRPVLKITYSELPWRKTTKILSNKNTAASSSL
jgi:hypothetical protein